MMRRFLVFGLLFLLVGGCTEQSPSAKESSPVLQATDFRLPDLDGEMQGLEQWRGQVVMLNFWAPWCPPCRKEVPAFIELQEKYADQGFTIVGITIDTQENAQTFADTMGINYPVLIAEEQGIDLARAYGNRVSALPYTVLLNRQGEVVFRHREELTLAQAEEALSGLLSSE